MSQPFPYVPSSGPIITTIEKFRSKFPNIVNAETFQKLGLAPNNEATVIYLLKFLGLIDSDGKSTKLADTFYLDDEKFQKAFSKIIEDAYHELFELHGKDAWSLDKTKLINFFRATDKASELTGTRKAVTFQALAGVAAQITGPTARTPKQQKNKPVKTNIDTSKTKNNSPVAIKDKIVTGDSSSTNSFGLTVRIEINLPAGGDKQTYDNIFKSIRENLIES